MIFHQLPYTLMEYSGYVVMSFLLTGADWLRRRKPDRAKTIVQEFFVVAFLLAAFDAVAGVVGHHSEQFHESLRWIIGGGLGVVSMLWVIQFLPGYLTDWSSGSSALARCPGWRLHRGAKWVFSQRMFTEILEPVLSDIQIDYFAALHANQPYKARWVQVRGYFCFWSHVGLQMPIDTVRVIAKLWKFGL